MKNVGRIQCWVAAPFDFLWRGLSCVRGIAATTFHGVPHDDGSRGAGSGDADSGRAPLKASQSASRHLPRTLSRPEGAGPVQNRMG